MDRTSTASATGAHADSDVPDPVAAFLHAATTLGDTVPTVGQRRAARRAQAVRTRTPDPKAAADRLTTYVPADPAAAAHTTLVRDLAASAGPKNAADATELLVALAHLAGWLDRTGLPVTPEVMLDRRIVDRWALHGLAAMTAGSSANYRSRVARVQQANTPAPAPVGQVLHRAAGCDPYTRAEEDALAHWAAGQRTDRLRDDLTALLGLCLGAGLSTAEALDATADHVTTTADGTVTVTVAGGRPRLVPVLPRWAPAVTAAAGSARPAGPGAFLLRRGDTARGGKNAVSNLVTAGLKGGGTPTAAAGPGALRPVPQRMRATWLLRHMQAATRMDVLLAISGLDGLGALDRYLPALTAQDRDRTAAGAA